MKKAILIVVMVLFVAANLSAVTIDTVAENDTVFNYPKSVNKTFGKFPRSEEYGIMLNITCRVEEGANPRELLFFRLSSGVVRDGKSLYTTIDGKKIMLAEKKWYGWKTADGVEIQYSIERTPQSSFRVWVEAE